MDYIYVVTYVNKLIREAGNQVSSTGAFLTKKDAEQEAYELRSNGYVNVRIMKLKVINKHSSLR